MNKENNTLDYTHLENKIINLESKLAFQEHTIQELNDIVTIQQTELMKFKTHLKNLSEQLESQSSTGMEDNTQEPPPPHY